MIKFDDIYTNENQNLYELSNKKNVLLVFLRHFGCVFCRESLKELGKLKDWIESQNTELVFVHMTEHAIAELYFEQFNLEGVQHISDPGCDYYQRFRLVKGTFNQLFGLQNMIRGFEVTLKGTFISLKQVGDGFQMPGIFLLKNGAIHSSFIHKYASDKPNYKNIVKQALNK